MDNNIKNLLEKFDIINKKGWIEGVSNSPSSVGLTFERELEKKLQKLAVIEASKDNKDEKNYFRYNKLTYYRIKSLEKFIYLLENRYINILIIAQKRNENEIYRTLTKNRKVQFQIDKDKIDYLFVKVLEYDADQELLTINTKEATC